MAAFHVLKSLLLISMCLYGIKATRSRIIYGNEMQGTIHKNPKFDVQLASARLLRAMNGWGTDEDAIIRILTTHDLEQRKETATYYKNYHRRYLIEDLKDETIRHFERAVVSLFRDPEELDSYWLHKATKKLGTDEMAMIAILTSLDGAGVSRLREFFDTMYPDTLSERIDEELSGDFLELMLALSSPIRQSEGQVDVEAAKADAVELSGRRSVSPIADVFFRIFSTKSFTQLNRTFEEYRKLTYWDIRDRIKEKFSSYTQTTLLNIVDRAENVAKFFSQWLHYSMHGAGTNENILTWIIVGRSEIDLENIKQDFVDRYEKKISYAVRKDTSSHYRDLLLSILDPPTEE